MYACTYGLKEKGIQWRMLGRYLLDKESRYSKVNF